LKPLKGLEMKFFKLPQKKIVTYLSQMSNSMSLSGGGGKETASEALTIFMKRVEDFMSQENEKLTNSGADAGQSAGPDPSWEPRMHFNKLYLSSMYFFNRSVLNSMNYNVVPVAQNLDSLGDKFVMKVRVIQQKYQEFRKKREAELIAKRKKDTQEDEGKFLDFVITQKPTSNTGKEIKELENLKKVEKEREKDIDSKKLHLPDLTKQPDMDLIREPKDIEVLNSIKALAQHTNNIRKK
jgi:hypothetical protein